MMQQVCEDVGIIKVKERESRVRRTQEITEMREIIDGIIMRNMRWRRIGIILDSTR